MNRISDIKNAEIIFNQNGVVGKLILKQENTEYVYLSFEPGSETSAHIQDILMTFYVSRGNGTVIIGDRKHQLKEGQVVEIPACESRQWKNTGDEILELFVVKNPG